MIEYLNEENVRAEYERAVEAYQQAARRLLIARYRLSVLSEEPCNPVAQDHRSNIIRLTPR